MPPDRRRDLEDELRDLGPRVEYPPTPDLAGPVRSRLGTERPDGDERDRRRVPAWAGWVVAAALLLLVAVPVLSLAVRGGMGGGAAGVASGGGAGDGGQGRVEVSSGDRAVGGEPEAGNERTMSSTQGAKAGSAAAGAASVASGEAATGYPAQQGGSETGSAGGFVPGERITLREARARSEGPILLPRSQGFGKPDKVYTSGFGPGFVLLYRAGSGLPGIRAAGVGGTDVGLLLTQTRGDVGEAYLTSGTVRGQDLETVSVNGARGYWVPPGQRFLKVARDLSPSTAVLLWERDGRALRIEADVPKEDAVRIAESVR